MLDQPPAGRISRMRLAKNTLARAFSALEPTTPDRIRLTDVQAVFDAVPNATRRAPAPAGPATPACGHR
jgi:hypothetical protein